MLGALASTALAWTGPTCPPATVVQTRPADGGLVPPGVPVELVLDLGCRPPAARLLGPDGAPVFVVAEHGVGRSTLTPVAPLAEGVHTVESLEPGGGALASFTVAADAPAPPWSAPEVSVYAERVCGEPEVVVQPSLAFDPDPVGWAAVRVELTTDGGPGGRFEQLWTGQAELAEVRARLPGVREACVAAALVSALGEEVWAGEPACEPVVDDCPPEASAGGGCAVGPVGGPLLVPLALALRRQRQRRRVSAGRVQWSRATPSS